MEIGNGVAALEENEGEMETDGSRARVRSVGLGLGTKWAGLVGGLGGLRLERPVGSAQVERKWPEAWLGLPLSSLSYIFFNRKAKRERKRKGGLGKENAQGDNFLGLTKICSYQEK